MDKIQEKLISEYFFSTIDEKCEEFALQKMLTDDFILIRDAHGKITKGIRVTRNNESQLYTIKKSCEDKYVDYYNLKLEDIIKKLFKENI